MSFGREGILRDALPVGLKVGQEYPAAMAGTWLSSLSRYYRRTNGRNKLYTVGAVVSTTTVGGEAKTAETLPAASFAQG